MKSSLVASSLVAASLCAATSVQAAGVWAGLDFKSAYTATGSTCNDGAVAQPCVDIYGLKIGEVELPLTFEFWGNIDLEKYDEDPSSKSGRFQEIDLAAYLNLGGYIDEDFTLDIGYLEYDYPNHDANTDHLIHFIAKYGIGLDNLGTIAPKFQAKYRFAGDSKGKCEYAAELAWNVTLAKEVVYSWDLGFSLAADAWYVDNRGQDRDEDGARPNSGWACSDVTAKVTLGNVYVGYQHIFRFEKSVLPDGPYGYDEKNIWMAGISYEF